MGSMSSQPKMKRGVTIIDWIGGSQIDDFHVKIAQKMMANASEKKQLK